MSQADVALIRAIYDAFAAGDVPGVLGRMSPDIVWNEAENFPYADGNPYLGPEAVLTGVFARIGAEWDGFAAVAGGVARRRRHGRRARPLSAAPARRPADRSTPSSPMSGGSRTARPPPSSNIPTRSRPPGSPAPPEAHSRQQRSALPPVQKRIPSPSITRLLTMPGAISTASLWTPSTAPPPRSRSARSGRTA